MSWFQPSSADFFFVFSFPVILFFLNSSQEPAEQKTRWRQSKSFFLTSLSRVSIFFPPATLVARSRTRCSSHTSYGGCAAAGFLPVSCGRRSKSNGKQKPPSREISFLRDGYLQIMIPSLLCERGTGGRNVCRASPGSRWKLISDD